MKKQKIMAITLAILLSPFAMVLADDVDVGVNVTNPAPQPVTETLTDVAQGVGNMILGMASPITVFMILMTLGVVLGYIVTSIGDRIGVNF